MLGHTMNQEEMNRRYREKIRKKVEEELQDRKSNDFVEHNFSVPDRRTGLEKKLNITLKDSNTNTRKKAEEFDQAWRDVIHRGDCALFDQIVHRDYYTENHGVVINKEQSRKLLWNRQSKAVMGPFKVIYENHDFLCIQRYSRVNLYTWFTMLSGVTYKEGKIYTQQTTREPLDKDPSENYDWLWEDYKSK